MYETKLRVCSEKLVLFYSNRPMRRNEMNNVVKRRTILFRLNKAKFFVATVTKYW